jgi:ABC-type polysaccharide/polyol phosphate export permease
VSTTPRRSEALTTSNSPGYAALDASLGVRVTAAVGDIAEGLRRWRSWTYLAVENVKNQYRRTVIGPWWLTLQTGAYVVGLAVLFGTLFHQPLQEFIPYVGGGFIGYTLLAGITAKGADVFVNNAGILLSTRQPLSMLVFQSVCVELLQFAHNLIIVVAFVAFGLVPVTPLLLLIIPAVLAIALNGVAIALWLGPTVARFRDVGPFVQSVLQVMVFFTPVFWRVDDISAASRGAMIGWNPFIYLLGLFRDPLLGEFPSALTWTGVAAVTAVNIILAFWVFTRSRSRLPYWVS